jgi:formylglycine-generating enzyme required for sulfatase activity
VNGMTAGFQRLRSTVTLLIFVPLLVATASYGQACDVNALNQAIERLQEDENRADAQTRLQQCGALAVSPLRTALNGDDAMLRLYAAETLGKVGWEAKSAVPELVLVSQSDRDLAVRSSAVQALSAIGRNSQVYSSQWRGWQTGEIQALQSFQQDLIAVLTALEKDRRDWTTKAEDLDALRRTRNALQTQLRDLTNQPSYRVVTWVQRYPWRVGGALLLVGVGSVYLSIFWWKPLWLLKYGIADQKIAATEKIPYVGTWLGWLLKLLSPLKYRPRVLDAWVEQHWQETRTRFLRLDTVKDRQIHIPLPVHLDGTPVYPLSGDNLIPTFREKTAVLLITGEGGAGKTSLTCQIALWGLEKQLAPHRLLPVLIETELDDQKTLIAAIAGQLKVLLNQLDDIPPELLHKLLQRQRILVIVDHLSEMSAATRKQITPELADFPAKALIVTSRLNEVLGVPKTVLNPLQIEANRLWVFMSEYLKSIDKPGLFEDDEYADACDRLRRMAGERSITVLLARLYIDHLIQEREGAGGILPDSVPKLMLSYLNRLNQNIDATKKQKDLTVQRDAQIVAWECLKQTYRPRLVKKAEAIAALEKAVKEDAPARLEYLEHRLQVLQSPDPGDSVRIILDPLAEYLAATYCVENHCRQKHPDAAWRTFFQEIDRKLDQANETSEVIRGFLLAVWDCCEDKAKEERIPDFVATELDAKAGVDRRELERVQEKRRIRKLISELSAPELEYRIRAAEDLGKRGIAAREATRNLIAMMENRNQETEVRQAAAETLGKLGMGAESLLTLLNDSREELAVRRSAAEALGLMKAGKSELLQILEDEAQPLPVRQGTARALRLIGAPSGEAVSMLIVTLPSDTQVKSIPVYRETLADNLTLDLVAIPAGEFLMGSPPNEAARDWYEYSFPELEGVDVEAQHQVTVPAFSMSQFPITQAQWRFVAGLPRINRDLEPDPANLKGDRRPVEVVSWYEAIEFCDRLSQHTGKEYRLPSEAEWEYACRAGTTQPFHFGKTLSTDTANYNGIYTYGDGEQGENRQQTTIVGSFGVVNAFGLSDMHGNVWEWCLDHWHPSYEGAPIDGSAWVTEGDSRYRLLRGGSWYYVPGYCRSANRARSTPDARNNYVGFRVVCVSPWTL